MQLQRNNAGFTLIELMITLFVVAIIVTVGVPNFRTFIQNNRIAAQTNAFISAITLARSEALKRGQNVTVCASADQQTCASNDWADGWIVFVDDNTAAQARPGGPAPAAPAAAPTAAEILRVWPPLEGGMTLTGTDDFLRFKPDGLADLDAARSFTLDIPDCTGKQRRSISVSFTGHTSVAHQDC